MSASAWATSSACAPAPLCHAQTMHVEAPPRSGNAASRAQHGTAFALGLASLGFVSLGLPEGLLGVAWPSIRATFGLPLDALGALLATFACGYFVSSAASGRILQRFGVGFALAGSCALTGTCLVGYALAPAWSTMVGCAGFLGLGAGTIDAGLNTYAAVRHGPRALNWMHAAFGIGAALGPLLMTAVLASGLSWTVGYLGVAVAQLALAAGYALTRASLGSAPTEKRTGGNMRVLLRSKLAWLLIALFFAYVGVEVIAGQWTYSLFTQSRGLAPQIAGALVSAYWASLTVGRVLFGALGTRVAGETLLRGCMLTIVVAAAVLSMNVPIASAIAIAVVGLAAAPIFPVLIAQTPARIGEQNTPDMVGLQVAAAVLGGAVLPASVGLLAARASLEVVGPCLLAAAIVLVLLHELLLRNACGRRRSERSRSDAMASSRRGA